MASSVGVLVFGAPQIHSGELRAHLKSFAGLAVSEHLRNTAFKFYPVCAFANSNENFSVILHSSRDFFSELIHRFHPRLPASLFTLNRLAEILRSTVR
jgi:hypothetical protein